MAATYKGLLTNNGKALIASATINNKINYSHIAVGDGNGSVPNPLETRTALVNEKARIALNVVEINPNNTNQIICEAIIPSNLGGFYIRELGLYAGTTMVVNASYPPTYKPLVDEGGAREIAIKLVINIQNAEVIALYLDDSLIYATRSWVDTNYIRRNELVDNLTTNDAKKPLSARMGKQLHDDKFSKSGGTLSGNLDIEGTITVLNIGDQIGAFKKLIQANTTTDGGYLAVGNTGQDRGFVEIGTTDDNDAEIYATQRNSESNVIRRAILLDGVGNTYFPEHVYAKTFNGGLNGNSSTATKLQTARDISFSGAATGSFNFDGSANASCILTLANSGVVASTYGSTLKIPVLTVNAKGLITGVSEQNIPIVDDLITDDGNKPLSARQGKKLQDEKFSLSGGQLSGKLTTKPSYLAQNLDDIGAGNNSPIRVPGQLIPLDMTGYIPFIHGSVITDGSGYVTQVSMGAYRGSNTWDNSGAYIAVGGKDVAPTEAFMFLNGRKISNTTGPIDLVGNASSANKLAIPRTVFGQPFDGSNDVGGTITASDGLVKSNDEYHYIDMGRSGLDRMSFYNYGAIFNFIDSQNGNVVARITSNGIDCNSATANKLKTARNIALSGAVLGSADFDGSGNITINTQLKENTAVARAYVNFSVSGGVVTINKSMNIASVVRNASGVFTLTFANALDDAEYVWSGSAYHNSNTKIPIVVNGSSDLVKSTTQLQVLTTYAASSTGTIDAGQVSVVVF